MAAIRTSDLVPILMAIQVSLQLISTGQYDNAIKTVICIVDFRTTTWSDHWSILLY